MSQNKAYLLIDHLDNSLEGEGLLAVEALIRDDKDAAREWQYLHFAVDAVQETALFEQVAAVKKQYLSFRQTTVAKPQPAVVRSIYRNALRAAACVLILLGAATVYKYTTVNSSSLYNKYYASFELNTSRGIGNEDAIEKAYRNKDWKAVIDLSDAQTQKTNKTFFLSGMASLELKNYNHAITAFTQVIHANAQSGDNYFEDESEYYLAMSYLANNEAGKAMPILKKIRADKNHLYHDKVQAMSGIDFMIVDQKAHK